MKLRYKLLAGTAAFLLVGYAALYVTVSHDSPCPPAPALEKGAVTMRSITQRCYGVPQAIRMEDVAKPTPGDDQVLIKVHAASINPVEWYGASGQPRLLRLQGGVGLPSDHCGHVCPSGSRRRSGNLLPRGRRRGAEGGVARLAFRRPPPTAAGGQRPRPRGHLLVGAYGGSHTDRLPFDIGEVQ